MATVTTMRCDGGNCGKLLLNDTNNWLVGWKRENVLSIGLMSEFNSEFLPGGTELHFCGEHCATRWFLVELGKLRGKEL